MYYIKQKISPFILDLIGKTTEDYRHFALTEVDHDPKSFTTHHSACKAALNHLHLLIRIYEWTDGSSGSAGVPSSGDDLAVLVQEARAAIGAYSHPVDLFDDEEGEL